MSYDFAIGHLDEDGSPGRGMPLAVVREAIAGLPAVYPNGEDGFVCCWDVGTGRAIDPGVLEEGVEVPDDVGWIEIDLAAEEGEVECLWVHVSYGTLERAVDRCLDVCFRLKDVLAADVFDLQLGELLEPRDREELQKRILGVGGATREQVLDHVASAADGAYRPAVLVGRPPGRIARRLRLYLFAGAVVAIILVWLLYVRGGG